MPRYGESQDQSDAMNAAFIPASIHTSTRGKRSHDEQPLQWEIRHSVHPVDANHERTVLVVHHLVAAGGRTALPWAANSGHRGAAQEPRFQARLPA